MRTIGVDAHVLDGKFQGSRTYLEGMLNALGHVDGTNRYVIYSRDRENTARKFPFPNFEHRHLGFSRSIPRLLLGFPYYRLRDRLDFLITNYISSPFFRGRQIVVVHDILFESHPDLFPPRVRWRNKLLVRLSVRNAWAVLTPSSYSREEIIRRYRLNRDQVRVTPNAVSAPVAASLSEDRSVLQRLLGTNASRTFALFVGRIEPRKNLDLLLTAWAMLPQPRPLLVVVGKGDFGADRTMERLRDQPAALHLEDLPDADLQALYRQAVVLVFPSRAEGFGIPIIEALAAGAKVISSNTTAMPEVGGGFTRLFDPRVGGAAETLARMIGEAFATPREPEPFGLREHLAQFDWRRSALEVVDLVNGPAARPAREASDV